MIGCSDPLSVSLTDADGRESHDDLPTYSPPADNYAVATNPYRNYLVIIDEEHPYEFDGTYDKLLQGDLVYLSDVYGEPTPIEKATACAFTELQYALKEKGVEIGLLSAYRTKEDQQWVVDHYRAEDWTVQDPGLSEHHTGLLVDILVKWPDPETGELIWMTETPERSKKYSESSKVLHRTLADYGFIDRYPVGKEEITGIMAMPNEIRFVGSSKVAHQIMDGNMALEEYY